LGAVVVAIRLISLVIAYYNKGGNRSGKAFPDPVPFPKPAI
jgi:hypothetical protein